MMNEPAIRTQDAGDAKDLGRTSPKHTSSKFDGHVEGEGGSGV